MERGHRTHWKNTSSGTCAEVIPKFGSRVPWIRPPTMRVKELRGAAFYAEQKPQWTWKVCREFVASVLLS